MIVGTAAHELAVLVCGPGLLTRPLRRILADEGFTALSVAADPHEAATRMRTLPFDVLVHAVTLPDPDGFQFIADLRSDPEVRNRTAVVLVVASGVNVQGANQALSMGADDVLFTPLMAGQISRKVKALTRAPRRYLRLQSGYIGPNRRRKLSTDILSERRLAEASFVGLEPLIEDAQSRQTGVLEA